VSTSVELLFDEFAAGWARGEHPDVRDFLERAGAERDELAALLDGFLAAAAVQPPSEETLATFASLLSPSLPRETATPPLLAERVHRGWRRGEIEDWIRERFGIGEEKKEKVARYWHELETGLLPLSSVSPRLREALAERFGEAAEDAVGWRLRIQETRLAFRRVADAPVSPGVLDESMSASPAQPERDEVDELFLPL
jgi:hypothetical protein